MQSTETRSTRQSVSLPARLSKQVRSIARDRRLSSSRVIVELIETGLAAREREKARFFELADRLSSSTNRAEQKQLKAELARLTFGE